MAEEKIDLNLLAPSEAVTSGRRRLSGRQFGLPQSFSQDVLTNLSSQIAPQRTAAAQQIAAQPGNPLRSSGTVAALQGLDANLAPQFQQAAGQSTLARLQSLMADRRAQEAEDFAGGQAQRNRTLEQLLARQRSAFARGQQEASLQSAKERSDAELISAIGGTLFGIFGGGG